jgi:hypothetical protein
VEQVVRPRCAANRMRISKYHVLRLACGLLLRKDAPSNRKTRHKGTWLSFLERGCRATIGRMTTGRTVMGLRMLQDVSHTSVPCCWVVSDLQLYHMDRFMV